MIHITACMQLSHIESNETNQEEIFALYISHYKLSIIEVYKILNYTTRKGSSGKFKSDNDVYSIYSILSLLDSYKPKAKSVGFNQKLDYFKRELSDWNAQERQIIELRNEVYAHLGRKNKIKSLKNISPAYVNNLVVLLNEFLKIVNEEFELNIKDTWDTNIDLIAEIYLKYFSTNLPRP